MSIESFLAESMKPQVFTSTTSASALSVSCQPRRGQPAGEFLGVDLVAGTAERHDGNIARLLFGHIGQGYPPSGPARPVRNRCCVRCVVSIMTPRTARTLSAPEHRSPEEGGELAEIRLQSDSAQTLSELASVHGLELTRFAYLICGDRSRADDLVQDVLLAMHRRFGSALPVQNPLAYARRAIVNANVSWSRRPMRREVPSDRLPERATEFSAPDEQLWQLLGTLGQRQRSVLVLRYYLGYPDADIAETLGCRRATVRSLAARALAELRGRLSTIDEGTPS